MTEIRDRALDAVRHHPDADQRLEEAAHLLEQAVASPAAINLDEWNLAAELIDAACGTSSR